ncbi:membrane-spanning 4-domains subfamily A member 8-like [Pteronotus mesoamericanus]|uniref:membrane-spanning 4-domains subfamily A member 8-like n=1 Tax=Pteronotus mesoamericanus TaxID=1884717 RepID=UPI0023EB884E|nr:membrane-spanning 4-domains subfamily A member 8-like [Pteronotus parnellii mesoamericanus]
MNSMTSAGPKASSVFVAAPPSTHAAIPGSMSQVPLYPHSQPQVHQIPGSQPGLQPPVYVLPAQTTLKEGKVLGALQIVIGMVHICLAFILLTSVAGQYAAVSFVGGYPFWGGITFIITGSLSVASEQQPNSPCLLKGSFSMNILSGIFCVIGIILFLVELILNSEYMPVNYNKWGVVSIPIPGKATSSVLLIFSLLELCIASTGAHFGRQLVSSPINNGPAIFQSVCVANPVANPEPVNVPPVYPSVDHIRESNSEHTLRFSIEVTPATCHAEISNE